MLSFDKVSVPRSPSEWRQTHAAHVQELRLRYDAVFRRMTRLDGIVIHGGATQRKYSRDDQYWPAAPTPHFLHWTPFIESPALLVLIPAARPKLFIQKHSSYWEGPAPINEYWNRDSFEIEFVNELAEVPVPKSHVYIGDERIPQAAAAWTGTDADDVVTALDALRTIKTNFEIASIRMATQIALRGHEALKDRFLTGSGVSELSLHHLYLQVTEQTDFSVPYSNIVALGRDAAVLHHVHYERLVRSGAMSLLVDAGASFNGYASDITRTWVRGEQTNAAAKLFSQLIDGVTVIQQKICDKFLVGTDYRELHDHSHELLAELLRETKLTSASVDELISSGATRCFFPHGLGHSLGLQVHDVGMNLKKSETNPYLRNTSVIAAGQVVTVEPGLYFIDDLLAKLRGEKIAASFNWELLEQLHPFGGIRIEDNMLATASGPVNLTRD